jgi:hypothetical protein
MQALANNTPRPTTPEKKNSDKKMKEKNKELLVTN